MEFFMNRIVYFLITLIFLSANFYIYADSKNGNMPNKEYELFLYDNTQVAYMKTDPNNNTHKNNIIHFGDIYPDLVYDTNLPFSFDMKLSKKEGVRLKKKVQVRITIQTFYSARTRYAPGIIKFKIVDKEYTVKAVNFTTTFEDTFSGSALEKLYKINVTFLRPGDFIYGVSSLKIEVK
jgi:hypothetical protein